MLTRKEFYRHLLKNNCEIIVRDGRNQAANQVEVVNKYTGSYFWIASPINETFVSPTEIKRACARLGVQLPDNYD